MKRYILNGKYAQDKVSNMWKSLKLIIKESVSSVKPSRNLENIFTLFFSNK